MDIFRGKFKLSPTIRLRRESFGGMLYDHKSGRIIFIYQEILFDLLAKKSDIVFDVYSELEEINKDKVVKLIHDLVAGGVILA
jgi:putative mycofactocin binding protein MftB